jgi:glycine cleavage system H lipoate-binding protein
MTVAFVILTIAFFLALDWMLERGRRHSPAAAGGARPALRLPRGVFFARSHTWLSLFPSGRAWLGVDDFIVHLLERPRVRVLKAPGERVARGEPLVALDEDGRSLVVRCPVGARVVAVNAAPAAASAGRTLFDGWVVELEPERVSELRTLLLGEETSAWIREELARLRDLLAGASPGLCPAALSDGGPPAPGALKLADAETWRRFEQEFLEVR